MTDREEGPHLLANAATAPSTALSEFDGPIGERAQHRSVQAIPDSRSVGESHQDSGVAQDAKVLGHGRLGKPRCSDDVAGHLRDPVVEHRHDGDACWIGEAPRHPGQARRVEAVEPERRGRLGVVAEARRCLRSPIARHRRRSFHRIRLSFTLIVRRGPPADQGRWTQTTSSSSGLGLLAATGL